MYLPSNSVSKGHKIPFTCFPSQELMAELLRYVYCGANPKGRAEASKNAPNVFLVFFLKTRWDVLLWRSRRNLQGRYDHLPKSRIFQPCVSWDAWMPKSAGKWDPDSEDVGYLYLGILDGISPVSQKKPWNTNQTHIFLKSNTTFSCECIFYFTTSTKSVGIDRKVSRLRFWSWTLLSRCPLRKTADMVWQEAKIGSQKTVWFRQVLEG